MEDQDIKSPGWEAIDAALAPIYGTQQPKHYGTVISYELGGPDPLRGISAYKRSEPVPHWHFVTYGFSELYEKESDNKEISGWGFELTMRLAADAAALEPPAWTLSFLQNLARYVFSSGNVFALGDYVNANGPIALDSPTLIHSMAFVADPELPAIDTPNGRLDFRQVVGLTNDEEYAAKQWKTLKVLEVFKPYMPLFVTDLDRQSLLAIEAVRNAVAAGAESEGSNTGHIFVDQLTWQEKKRLFKPGEITVTLGARQLLELKGLLRYRVAFGRTFSLIGQDAQIVFKPYVENRYRTDGSALNLDITAEAVAEMDAKALPVAGVYTFDRLPFLVLKVIASEIKDHAGRVVETIG